MKSGIYTMLFQRLGIMPKAQQAAGDETAYGSLKHLNDLRLKQLSTGWTPPPVASSLDVIETAREAEEEKSRK